MTEFRYYILIILSILLLHSCGSKNESDSNCKVTFSLTDTIDNPYTAHFDSMPNGGRKLRINSPGPLGRVFNDSNYRHLAAAKEIGLKPVETTSNIWKGHHDIKKIETNRYYYVDRLTHSLPFLVPEAEQLLEDIARTWRDSLESRGGGHYRLKVTSVLRTPATIAKLRRRNRNAVEESAHQYGTTFDISYAKFICDSVNIPRTQEDLKNLLGEVLAQFRNEGRCYVKYERKQGCFHITARKNLRDTI